MKETKGLLYELDNNMYSIILPTLPFGYGADVHITRARKFYEIKKKKYVYDWVVLWIRVTDYTKGKKVTKIVERKLNKVFGYDYKEKQDKDTTVFVRNLMYNVTKSNVMTVSSTLASALKNEGGFDLKIHNTN